MAEQRLFLFDADETLWTSENRDWVGSVDPSTFSTEPGNLTIRRDADGQEFTLRDGTHAALAYLEGNGVRLGIISDNVPEAVQKGLEAFHLQHAFESSAVNVRLWKGHCPKEVMIEEVLALPQYQDIRRDHVYFLDDKPYQQETQLLGINFRQVNLGENMLDIVKEYIP